MADAALATDDIDYSIGLSIRADKLLGPGVATVIRELQRTGRLPGFRDAAWARLVELAADGAVSIAPVLLIGDSDYVCEPVVEERLRTGTRSAPPPPPPRPAPAPPRTSAPVSLADEIRSWK